MVHKDVDETWDTAKLMGAPLVSGYVSEEEKICVGKKMRRHANAQMYTKRETRHVHGG